MAVEEKKVISEILALVKDKKIGTSVAYELIKKLDTTKSKSIAIVGMACRLPGAKNKEIFWKNILEKKSSISAFPESRKRKIEQLMNELPDIKNSYGGYLDTIDELSAEHFRLSPKESIYMEPAQKLFLETAVDAIEDSGQSMSFLKGTRTGVYLGREHSTYSPPGKPAEYKDLLEDIDFLGLTGTLPSLLPSRLSYILNLKGPSFVVDTACSSSLVAIDLACKAMVNGECDMAIAGGVHINLVPLYLKEIMVESDEPNIYPFDQRAKGTLWGEGAGVLFLKRLDDAVRDRDSIYSVIIGSSINQDGASNGLTAPDAGAQKDLLLCAWKDANINPASVGYIEAHGSGTLLGDSIEVNALNNAFEKMKVNGSKCAITSVKPNIGHLRGAAGVASLIKASLALKKKIIPPQINFEEPSNLINFETSRVFVNTEIQNWINNHLPRRAGVSSFGFSGTNCHIVLEEPPLVASEAPRSGCRNVFLISAKQKSQLLEHANEYIQYFNHKGSDESLDDISYTLACGRSHAKHRLAVIMENSVEKLKEKLDQFITSGGKSNPSLGIWHGKKEGLSSNRQKIKLLDREAQSILKENRDMVSEQEFQKLCEMHVNGATVDWSLFFNGSLKRINLPPSPREVKSYWPKIKQNRRSSESTLHNSYEMRWICRPVSLPNSKQKLGINIIFKDKGPLSIKFLSEIKKRSSEPVIIVESGERFEKMSEDAYTISNSKSSFQALAKAINFDQVKHIWWLYEPDPFHPSDRREFDDTVNGGPYKLFRFIKSLLGIELKSQIEMVLVTKSSIQVLDTEKNVDPVAAGMHGLVKVVNEEVQNLSVKIYDIDEKRSVKPVVDDVISHIGSTTTSYVTVYRNTYRYLEELQPRMVKGLGDNTLKFDDESCYLVIGGTGGIGAEIMYFLGQHGVKNICIIGRSALPPEEKWGEITQNQSDRFYSTVKYISDLSQMGVRVDSHSVDITDYSALKEMINKCRNTFGKIKGVFHCAGISGKGLLVDTSFEDFKRTLKSKFSGVYYLDRLTRSDDLDYFVMFSSESTLRGIARQGDYTCANAFLDSYAYYRNSMDLNSITLNWPAWKEIGMMKKLIEQSGANESDQNNRLMQYLDSVLIFNGIKTRDALEVFGEVLQSKAARVIVGELNEKVMLKFHESHSLGFEIPTVLVNYLEKNTGEAPSTMSREESFNLLKKSMEENSLKDKLAEIWSNVLKFEKVDYDASLFELGGDSIHSIQLHQQIEAQFPMIIDTADVMKYSSINKMMTKFEKKLSEYEIAG